MGFDYTWTCPTIDGYIRDTKDTIHDRLLDILGDACPLFVGKERDDFLDSCTDLMYGDLKPLFEGVRKCNEDMRSEAENQIDRLNDNISDLKMEVYELKSNINTLENEIKLLENE